MISIIVWFLNISIPIPSRVIGSSKDRGVEGLKTYFFKKSMNKS